LEGGATKLDRSAECVLKVHTHKLSTRWGNFSEPRWGNLGERYRRKEFPLGLEGVKGLAEVVQTSLPAMGIRYETLCTEPVAVVRECAGCVPEGDSECATCRYDTTLLVLPPTPEPQSTFAYS
jgi:hypothetical protein